MAASAKSIVASIVLALLAQGAQAANPKPAKGAKPEPTAKPDGVRFFPKGDWEARHVNQSKVGDVAEYVNAKGEPVEKLTVTEVGDHRLVVQIEKPAPSGGEIHAGTKRITFKFESPDLKAGPGFTLNETDDKLSVLGKVQTVHKVELLSDNKPVWQKWYSDDVPLGGLVQSAKGAGHITMALKDYQRGK
jgi:hypothetical protein